MSFFKKIFSSEKKEPILSEQETNLRQRFRKIKSFFFSKLTKAVAGKSKVDDEVLDNLEEFLFLQMLVSIPRLKIITRIEKRVAEDKYLGTDELNQILREEIAGLLSETNLGEATEFEIPLNKKPYVIDGCWSQWSRKNYNYW
jgi:fused signal recognition particle receptor